MRHASSGVVRLPLLAKPQVVTSREHYGELNVLVVLDLCSLVKQGKLTEQIVL